MRYYLGRYDNIFTINAYPGQHNFSSTGLYWRQGLAEIESNLGISWPSFRQVPDTVLVLLAVPPPPGVI